MSVIDRFLLPWAVEGIFSRAVRIVDWRRGWAADMTVGK